jgi:hypothetical protein
LLDHPHQQSAERLKVRGIAQENINAGDIGLMMAQGLFKYGRGFIYLFNNRTYISALLFLFLWN